MTTVLCTLGTRPEVIKLAPVVKALRARPSFRVRVLFTGQHRALLDQMATFFGIAADADLRVMQPGQTLPELTARLVTGLDAVLAEEKPDVVLGQGDTTTVLCTGLACYYRKIPFGHVEAGLRTPTIFSPFPEEGNRRLVSVVTAHHFAPTEEARQNLLREGIPAADVHMTGNTVVDALLSIAALDLPLPVTLDPTQRLILVTLHRRESFGAPIRAVLGAIRRILDLRRDVCVVYPVHPNPMVEGPAHELLGDHPRVRLVKPVEYGEMVALMKRATLLLTDSGGVQEEAPSLGVPLLVTRETTERPEGVRAGVARLVGTDSDTIVAETLRLLDDSTAREAMRTAHNPYGDGKASERIADVLERAYHRPTT